MSVNFFGNSVSSADVGQNALRGATHFFYGAEQAVTFSATNTFVPVSDGGSNIVWAEQGTLNGFTLSDTNTGKMTYNGPDGYIKASFYLRGHVNGGAANIIVCVLMLNGVSNSVNVIRGQGAGSTSFPINSATAKFAVSNGDTLEIQIANANTTSSFVVAEGLLSLFV